MDADFIPPLGMYNYLEKYATKDISSKNLIAYVVPSFASSLPRLSLPDTKDKLLLATESETIIPTNLKVCPRCHTPTNYKRWYTETQPYEAEYKWIYEPYLMFRRDQLEPFDERLKGYGFDKNSHTFGMAVQGFKFMVLPNAWIVHMNHPKQVWDGTDSFDEQMWDSLKVVCEILPSSKAKYGYKPNEQLYDEPLEENCYSREHW
eukprot:gene8443-9932_t